MYPRISDLVNHLFGSHIELPIQTYGFFLALGFLTGGTVLYFELKRKGNEGLLPVKKQTRNSQIPSGWPEIISTILLTSIIAWKLVGVITHYDVFVANPQHYIMSGNGSTVAFFLCAIFVAAYQIYKRGKARKMPAKKQEILIPPEEYTWNIVVVAIVSAIVGSKLFDIFDNLSDFTQHPLQTLFSFSGLTFYGGLIVTVITLMFYMWVLKLDWKHVIDSAAPAIMIGYAIGRLGCHFSGDGCWGIVNDLPCPAWIPDFLWSNAYPHNVINQGIPIADCAGHNCMILAKPVYPTSLYESLISFFSFGILWLSRKAIKAPVCLFGLFLVLNGVERFFIEKIRVNHKYDILGIQLTQAEIISALLVVAGIFIIYYYRKKYKEAKHG